MHRTSILFPCNMFYTLFFFLHYSFIRCMTRRSLVFCLTSCSTVLNPECPSLLNPECPLLCLTGVCWLGRSWWGSGLVGGPCIDPIYWRASSVRGFYRIISPVWTSQAWPWKKDDWQLEKQAEKQIDWWADNGINRSSVWWNARTWADIVFTGISSFSQLERTVHLSRSWHQCHKHNVWLNNSSLKERKEGKTGRKLIYEWKTLTL